MLGLWSVKLAPPHPLPKETVFYGTEEKARERFQEEMDRLLAIDNPDDLWVMLFNPEDNEIMTAPCQSIQVRRVSDSSEEL